MRRRRKSSENQSEATGRGEAPAYRRDDGAVEYEAEKDGRRQDSLEERRASPVGKAAKGGFHPLPRCPSCRTAIGFEQKECHSCGRQLRKV
ncbi:TPA: hypothetical protein HA259_04805 [Thermoplasmata archaeon]|nr:hypothetical protein [Thermoplasmata archaeon]